MAFQCYIFPLSGEYHEHDIGLEYLKLYRGYGYSVNRPLRKGTIIMFAHTLSRSFVGETVATTDTYKSPIKDWKYEVGYDPNAIFRYVPHISYDRLSLIPRFRGKIVHSIVRNYPSLSKEEYLMMTKGISKHKI